MAFTIASRRTASRTALAGAAVIAVLATAGFASAADNPLPGLIGTWSGPGEAVLDSGETEKMMCKGYYTGQGNGGLGLAIRCANPSSKIDLRASLTFSNGDIAGTWEERTYNAGGTVSGKATAGTVTLKVDGSGGDASMAVAITGATHSVSITTQGTGLKSVKINLSRS